MTTVIFYTLQFIKKRFSSSKTQIILIACNVIIKQEIFIKVAYDLNKTGNFFMIKEFVN